MKRIISQILIFFLFFQPLGLVTSIFAETINIQYSDLNHLHAPKVVNGVTYQYDENGNLISDGEKTIEWNEDNLPIKIKKGDTEVKFFYDASGRRIVKSSKLKVKSEEEQETKTIYVNQYLTIQQFSNEIIYQKYYFAQGRRIAQRTIASNGAMEQLNNQLSFYHHDHLGSTILATDLNSQPVSNSLSYFPYGNSTNYQQPFTSHQQPITNYLYTGQELDPESDLYNYNARLYNPKTGVFISADTVGGGNRYVYANNNPMVFTDPTGHYAQEKKGPKVPWITNRWPLPDWLTNKIWFQRVVNALGFGLSILTPYQFSASDKYLQLTRPYGEFAAMMMMTTMTGNIENVGSPINNFQIPDVTLDLGIGQGGGYLNEVLEGDLYVGVDINFEALQTVKQNYPNVQPVVADAENLPFASGSFDKLVSVYPKGTLLEKGMQGSEGWFGEFTRVMKTEGTLEITSPTSNIGPNRVGPRKFAPGFSDYFEMSEVKQLRANDLRRIGTYWSRITLEGLMCRANSGDSNPFSRVWATTFVKVR